MDRKNYQILGVLLADFGNEKISAETFWHEMQKHGFGQDDIDAFCDRFYAEAEIQAGANGHEH